MVFAPSLGPYVDWVMDVLHCNMSILPTSSVEDKKRTRKKLAEDPALYLCFSAYGGTDDLDMSWSAFSASSARLQDSGKALNATRLPRPDRDVVLRGVVLHAPSAASAIHGKQFVGETALALYVDTCVAEERFVTYAWPSGRLEPIHDEVRGLQVSPIDLDGTDVSARIKRSNRALKQFPDEMVAEAARILVETASKKPKERGKGGFTAQWATEVALPAKHHKLLEGTLLTYMNGRLIGIADAGERDTSLDFDARTLQWVERMRGLPGLPSRGRDEFLQQAGLLSAEAVAASSRAEEEQRAAEAMRAKQCRMDDEKLKLLHSMVLLHQRLDPKLLEEERRLRKEGEKQTARVQRDWITEWVREHSGNFLQVLDKHVANRDLGTKMMGSEKAAFLQLQTRDTCARARAELVRQMDEAFKDRFGEPMPACFRRDQYWAVIMEKKLSQTASEEEAAGRGAEAGPSATMEVDDSDGQRPAESHQAAGDGSGSLKLKLKFKR